jgi:hypothetical protein
VAGDRLKADTSGQVLANSCDQEPWRRSLGGRTSTASEVTQQATRLGELFGSLVNEVN